MSRTYKNNWYPKKMVVNFNQKQWRQDLASFIVNKLNWYDVRVSRSRTIEKSSKYNEGIKEFEIYDSYNNYFKVTYSNQNTIISTSHPEILNEYLINKGI